MIINLGHVRFFFFVHVRVALNIKSAPMGREMGLAWNVTLNIQGMTTLYNVNSCLINGLLINSTHAVDE